MFKCKSKYNRNSKQCFYESHSVNDMGMHLRMHREQFNQMKRNAQHTSNNHGTDANQDNVNDIQSQPFDEAEIVVEIISYSDDETIMEDVIEARRKRYKSQIAARVAAQSNVRIDIVTISSDDEVN